MGPVKNSNTFKTTKEQQEFNRKCEMCRTYLEKIDTMFVDCQNK